ncbi:hypothetical protein [Desulfocurvus vexinensis]|uniref:hypothetical protein n=1 Tax=Desulfocurvus vexinensis TaxID=399548 RepID=UPI00048AB73B|nr:hypothetical protein [Desulfocurvus vexinensis]
MSARATTLDTTLAAWDGLAPDWVRALAEECDRVGSQRIAAERVGYSPAAINQVLKNKYRGSLDSVAVRVRAVLMGETVSCPILGVLDKEKCLEHQAKPFSAASSQRVRLWQACRACAHNINGQEVT